MNGLATDTRTDNYRVKLEVFSGPLDLLLHLIKVEEVDIYDIPIARITAQYLRYIEVMKNLDLEVAGEFILMAATLIRIKVRLLLPQDEVDSEEPDPREELIMALIEYKKYKEAGDLLRDRMIAEESHFVPAPPLEEVGRQVDLTPMTSLYDLIVAFRDVMAARKTETVHEVNNRRVSIEDRMKVIVDLIGEQGYATLAQLFADRPQKLVAVVTFIAVLELARLRRIRVCQAVPFSEVRIYPRRDTDSAPDAVSADEDPTIEKQSVAG